MKLSATFIPGMMLLFMSVACSVQEEDKSKDQQLAQNELCFTAEFGEIDTKTAFQADETSIWWSPADEICIYYGASGGSKFTSTNTVEVSKAQFRGNLSAFTGESESGDFNYFMALYPYSAAMGCDGEYIEANLSEQQVAKAGSFAPNTNISLAKNLGLSLSFFNVCSWFRFSVKKEGVKIVTFRGNGNEDVAGMFRVAMDDNGLPTRVEVRNGVKEITLRAPDGGNFEVGKMYYITLLPQVFNEGFTVTFNTASETGSRSINSKATYLRSKYNTGVNFDRDIEYSPRYDLNDNIEFADMVAKYACVEKFDTNGDGEISYAEAAAVTSLDGLFDNWNAVQYFDEMKYFINVTSTGQAFRGLTSLKSVTIPSHMVLSDDAFAKCSSLEEVILPEGLTEIPPAAFFRCSALKRISFPNSLETIGNQAFHQCTSITELDFPESLKYISNSFNNCSGLTSLSFPKGITLNSSFEDCNNLSEIYLPVDCIINSGFKDCEALTSVVIPSGATLVGAFSGCTNLREIIWNDGVKEIGSSTFWGCSSLKEVIIPDGVTVSGGVFGYCSSLQKVHLPSEMTSIGDSFFYECSSLEEFNFPDAVTEIGEDAFYGCAKLKEIHLGNNVQEIGSYAFEGCSFVDSVTGKTMIDLPESVNVLGSFPFGNNRHIILRSTKLVSVKDNTFAPGTIKVYVPSNLLPVYKARTIWSSMADFIYGIEEYPTNFSPIAIDLGLPSGTKWANVNIGAEFTDEAGDLFAWGEITPKSSYSNDNYKWSSGMGADYLNLIKYNSDETLGLVDEKTELDSEDDAAFVNWGETWRMPSEEQVVELFNNCSISSSSRGNRAGIELTSNLNGRTVFFPTAAASVNQQNGGHYWTRTSGHKDRAKRLYFNWFAAGSAGTRMILYLPDSDMGEVMRSDGCCVRAVTN